jgi:magnesium transporter
MQIDCYHITDKPQIISCEYDAAIDMYRQGKANVWIDILDANKEELEQQLNELKIDGLLRSFCLGASDHPGFYPLHPLSLIVLPVQMTIQDSNRISYLSILLSSRFLVTIRESSMARFRSEIAFNDSANVLPDGTTAGIIALLLLGLSLEGLRKTSKLSDVISEIENRLDKAPQLVKMEELSDRRSDVMVLESIVSGQLPILKIVSSSNRKLNIEETTKDYLQWSIANLEATEKKLDWLEHRIDLMRSSLDMHAQETMNNRLGRLTILSMIFMPITFLAGIWGMNFQYIPLLSNEYGYAIAILLMLLIAGSMYMFFKKKGWFD